MQSVQQETPAALEPDDALISLHRAAMIAQLPEETLLAAAQSGNLQAYLRDDAWYTNRRWLHIWLLNDLGAHRATPLPPGYVAPAGMPQRKLRTYPPGDQSTRRLRQS